MSNKISKGYEIEPLKLDRDLEGISLKSVREHKKLYDVYVKKTNEIQKKINEADKSAANAVYSEIGELKRQETFAVNGMKLHEAYFPLLGGDGKPKGKILEMIEKDFGSYEAWKEDFTATGMSARGWAVLAYEWKDNRLHNYGMDAQNVGAIWDAEPIIAMDMYEHAFFMDHGTDKKAYVEAFFKTLNWDYVDSFVEKHNLYKRHGGVNQA
ncbi:superoxide dismutase [Candidatus Jorgensenbacteria bacterium RIFCSPLOWO2_02_FULL_45_12]|nr:MAG: superoxide dismutase [Candidatus Jorgensenbacteria bacterium RIFCSPHIGHO2_02_FULL_45_20]OGG42356.1 MAG: superoxide dismutase [Candidatus Jorgensenbacteria bacterium RIFCSPLOWO2_02_FULL_45_12]